MNLIVVTYDLNKPHKDYNKLYKRMDELGEHRKPTESTYVLKTNLEPHDVSAKIRDCFDSDDAFFVVKAYRSAAGTVDPDDFWKWFDFS